MIQENINLKPLSSFNIGGNAEFYVEVKTTEELIQAVDFAQSNNLNITTLGKASNVIIADTGIKGLVVRLGNKEISKVKETEDFVYLKAGAGLTWDNFVAYCVEKGLYGVENLSYIPGSVGASAVQNIGAYGQEVCSTIDTIIAYDLKENKFVEIANKEANFAYRKSIFNSTEKGRYIIFEIIYKLLKSAEFSLNYQDMAYFREDNDLSLLKIRQEIIKIRQKKLPDYYQLPNVGSFFKNIVVTKEKFEQVLAKVKSLNPEKTEKLKSFKQNNDSFKIPTALLIEICGLKGFKQENIAIYNKHALIVINHSKKGSAQDVKDFAEYIINEIKTKLDVEISVEPTFIS